ncbi:DNA cytosine methyltransferase [Gloeothece verrucosa]|uniref:Cytosine-specific methyltransferase n=1 Tax=Gloeothece verrucosa (strain PCC 7822) TaxID=497965 RepID=E0U5Q6_GLOV7|nr:DNA cytosine methyltransferase [Gloeothece verrucosa]ADN15897.1 DNA-cytosine methyltransferase [Gloeothece verrucosa PCC 7822]
MISAKKRRPIAVDLFAGAGGMSLGFEQAGFDVLASVEIDPIHCATHEYNFPFSTMICRSVTEITAREIRNLSPIGTQDIDVVFGGPPCQGFSLIGKRLLDDPRNDLIYHFLRLVLELNPKYFILENVPGMALGKHKKLIEEIINKFQENNYNVEENIKILNAAHYGVPQNRERLFLLGSQKGLVLPQYPEPITAPNPFQNLSKTPTVWEALQDLPEVNHYPELETRDWVAAEWGNPSDYARKLREMALENDYLYQRQYDMKVLTSSLRTEHTAKSIERFAMTPPGKIEPISRFYKLSPDGLCNTLRAGTPSNRGAYTSPRPIHPFTPRCITVREAARLHSYPDWFRFHVTKWHGFRQIGNSVPPLLAKAVALEIMKVLRKEISKPSIIIPLGEEKLLSFNMSSAAEYYGVDPKVVGTRTKPLKI